MPALSRWWERRHSRKLLNADDALSWVTAFEWQKQGASKTPLFLHLNPERSFGFAGLMKPDSAVKNL
jgi:putative SOS response-associated peptidase YedK